MIEDSLYEDILLPINEVYNIFKDYFGEKYVDLQNIAFKEDIETIASDSTIEAKKIADIRHLLNREIISGCNPPYIIVHFPLVKVENEFNKFTYVNDLWVKVEIDYKGFLLGRFTINRSTYSYEQFMSDYQHSHTPGINYSNYTRWSIPCTGTGPINHTIDFLKRSSSATMWQLFCVELDKYVHVESIQGVPYRRLESIGTNHSGVVSDTTYIDKYSFERGTQKAKKVLLEFLKYYINNYDIKVGYKNNVYVLGDSLSEFIIKFSNAFIKWFNEYSCTDKTSIKHDIEVCYMQKCIYNNDRLYYNESSNSSYKNPSTAEGSLVLTFKGQEIKLHILSDLTKTNNLVTVFNPSLVCYIIDNLLNIINTNYGRK